MQQTAASVPLDRPQRAFAPARGGCDGHENAPQLQRDVELELDEGENSPFSEDSPTYGSPLTVGNVTFSGKSKLKLHAQSALLVLYGIDSYQSFGCTRQPLA